MTIILDTKAFDAAKIANVEDQPISLKPVKDATLGAVIKQVVEQAKATYRVEGDKIIIVPKTKK